MSLYALTPRTAARVRQIVADGGSTAGEMGSGAPARGVTWVKVTGAAVSGWYPGVVSLHDAGAWVDRAEAVRVQAADGVAALTTGTRYLCTRDGDEAGTVARFKTAPPGGSGGTLTVRAIDLSPSFSGIGTVEYDEADGYILTNPSAGVARLDFFSASPTQKGAVDTGDQSWDGIKGSLDGFRAQVLGAGNAFCGVNGPGAFDTFSAPTLESTHTALAGAVLPVYNSNHGVQGWASDNDSFILINSPVSTTNVGTHTWIIHAPDTDGYSGRLINTGRYAYWKATGGGNGTIHTGATGAIAPGALVAGGIVYDLGTGSFYSTGGTDVALADGGTGASLSDPNADRMMFWDDSAGQVTWLAPDAAGVEISGTTLRLKNQGTVADLTNSTGGTVSDTIGAQGASYSQTALNDALGSLAAKVNQLTDALQAAGLIS